MRTRCPRLALWPRVCTPVWQGIRDICLPKLLHMYLQAGQAGHSIAEQVTAEIKPT